jgi:hypothetical protein
VKDLTPKIGPHPHDIVTRGQSSHHAEPRPIAGLTREADGLRHRREHLTALPDHVEYLAAQLARVTETVAVLGAWSGSNPRPSWQVLPADTETGSWLLDELTVGLAARYLRYPDGARELSEPWRQHADIVEELVYRTHARLVTSQGKPPPITRASRR